MHLKTGHMPAADMYMSCCMKLQPQLVCHPILPGCRNAPCQCRMHVCACFPACGLEDGAHAGTRTSLRSDHLLHVHVPQSSGGSCVRKVQACVMCWGAVCDVDAPLQLQRARVRRQLHGMHMGADMSIYVQVRPPSYATCTWPGAGAVSTTLR